jgi:hypothetical protein
MHGVSQLNGDKLDFMDFVDLSFWFPVATVAVAIYALFQTQSQIKTSNKQHLFDRRMRVYMVADGLIQLFLSNRNFFYRDKEDEPQLAIDLHFMWLTNNTYLEKISSAIKTPLSEQTHKEFLIKLEEIKAIANEARLIFSGKPSMLLSEFIQNYQKLLFSIYQYQILLGHMHESSDKWRWTLEKSSERLHEPEQRKELYAAIDNLKQAYEAVVNEQAMEKLEEQIKL